MKNLKNRMVIKNRKLPKIPEIPKIQGPVMKIKTNLRKVKLRIIKMMTIVHRVKKIKAMTIVQMTQNQMEVKRTKINNKKVIRIKEKKKVNLLHQIKIQTRMQKMNN